MTAMTAGTGSSVGDEQERRPAEIMEGFFENLPSPLPAPLPFVDGSHTIVVLPDTQVYSDKYPEVFEHQTRWIAEQRDSLGIRFVLHVGDITERSSDREWRVAKGAMGLLDGVVPYAMAVGNHDCGANGWSDSRDSMFSTLFPVRQFKRNGSLGGTFELGVSDNSYHLFTAGGRDWIAVMLEWGPRQQVVKWADGVLRAYADRTAIIVTHAYMYYDNTRYDRILRSDQVWNPYDYPTADLPGGVSDGEDLWRDLVSMHGNVAMVLSGHVLGDGVGYLASTGKVGNTVHQMLSNYQMLPDGGRGYLRLLEIMPDGETIQVKTYSPVYDDYMTSDRQQFVIKLDVRLGRPCIGSRACDPYAGVLSES